jgi:hypothetical protein
MTTLVQMAPGDHVRWGVEPRLSGSLRYATAMACQPQAALTMPLRAKPICGEEKQ